MADRLDADVQNPFKMFQVFVKGAKQGIDALVGHRNTANR
jgi:hypothetical protein